MPDLNDIIIEAIKIGIPSLVALVLVYFIIRNWRNIRLLAKDMGGYTWYIIAQIKKSRRNNSFKKCHTQLSRTTSYGVYAFEVLLIQERVRLRDFQTEDDRVRGFRISTLDNRVVIEYTTETSTPENRAKAYIEAIEQGTKWNAYMDEDEFKSLKRQLVSLSTYIMTKYHNKGDRWAVEKEIEKQHVVNSEEKLKYRKLKEYYSKYIEGYDLSELTYLLRLILMREMAKYVSSKKTI
jgi:hypothetical protein